MKRHKCEIKHALLFFFPDEVDIDNEISSGNRWDAGEHSKFFVKSEEK